jgi:glutathione reductase (NADPH)
MKAEDVDLFVIGGGSGGVRAARIAAQHGARVALAEQSRIGGTCVIRGCVPKKLMVVASRLSDVWADAPGLGWSKLAAGSPGSTASTADSTWAFDWPRYTERVRAEVARLEAIYTTNLEAAGVRHFAGRAVLQDAHTVVLKPSQGPDVTFSAGCVLVATGGHPDHDPSLPGAEWVEDSDAFFEWREQPRSVLVIGSGYIALELATALLKLGSRVTLLVRGERVLKGFDEDLQRHLQDSLVQQGLDLRTATQLRSVAVPDQQGQRQGKRLATLSDGSVLSVDRVLRATGRRPSSAGLGLEALGVAMDARGAITVDEWSATSVPGIFAVGDVTGRVALTPAAIREGHAFADTRFGQRPTPVAHGLVPTAVFTTPEVGTVGLSEAAARALHGEVDIYETRFRPMAHAMAGREIRTYLKLVVNRRDDRVLGVHLIAPEAGEMVQLIGIALQAGVTKRQWDATLPVHPTIAEELVTLRKPVR